MTDVDKALHCEFDKHDDVAEIKITPKMVEAGELTILEEVGGADLGGSFLASELDLVEKSVSTFAYLSIQSKCISKLLPYSLFARGLLLTKSEITSYSPSIDI
jgi:hypothetical protein